MTWRDALWLYDKALLHKVGCGSTTYRSNRYLRELSPPPVGDGSPPVWDAVGDAVAECGRDQSMDQSKLQNRRSRSEVKTASRPWGGDSPLRVTGMRVTARVADLGRAQRAPPRNACRRRKNCEF